MMISPHSLAFAALLSLSLVVPARAQTTRDMSVQVSAAVQTGPNRITLYWPADTLATGFTVYRKNPQTGAWGPGTALAGSITNYTDNAVSTGTVYEYRVQKQTAAWTVNSYISAAIRGPFTDLRGKLLLLVDDTVAGPLNLELQRLQWDLAGDGWTVLRQDVARTGTVASVKAAIQAAYDADPQNVRAVFLFGHVPVPYSGNIYPDGHTPDHRGAWPADGYYGDMNGTWTDATVNYTGSSDPRNRNIPGDGKFDQAGFPSALELQVGRVDFANLPAIPVSEVELLRRYLEKNHRFRHGHFQVPARGLIDDEIGVLNPTQPYREAFAANGWRLFSTFFGAANTVAGDWMSTLQYQPYLWGMGAGFGSYTTAGGVASTAELATNETHVVFTMFFGSYFGDWDGPNNLMRAQLASSSYTLSTVWAGRPFWMFHPMALGETLGAGALLTQNNSNGIYDANAVGDAQGDWMAHVGLLGDPTLRMQVVTPPAQVVAEATEGVDLTWAPSPDATLGYHLYRATSAAGPYTRITPGPVTVTGYNDFSGNASHVYMVRAVKLESSASGTYTNMSQGIFCSVNAAATRPWVTILQPTNNTVRINPVTEMFKVSVSDPSGAITNVSFWAGNVKVAQSASPPYTTIWTNPVPGVYNLQARAECAGFLTNSSPVTITIDNGGSPRLTIAKQGDGSRLLTGADPLGRTFTILGAPAATGPWIQLGTTTAVGGVFQFTDPDAVTNRFYRTRYP